MTASKIMKALRKRKDVLIQRIDDLMCRVSTKRRNARWLESYEECEGFGIAIPDEWELEFRTMSNEWTKANRQR